MKSDLPIPSRSPHPLLQLKGVSKRYVRGGLLWNRTSVAAVGGVDLEIFSSRTLALVGESGSGKSTVARCVARLEDPDSGEIWFDSDGTVSRDARATLLLRTQVQMVFQDATTSMNP